MRSARERTDRRRVPAVDGRGASGFTLIEAVVVLAVLGVLVGVGIPLLNSSLSSARLDTASGALENALNHARLAAMESGNACRVSFDTGADTVRIEREEVSISLLGTETELPEGSVETVTFEPLPHPLRPFDDFVIDVGNEERFGGVDIASADFGGETFVAFDGRGRPNAEGSILLTLGSRSVTLSLDGATGRLTVN